MNQNQELKKKIESEFKAFDLQFTSDNSVWTTALLSPTHFHIFTSVVNDWFELHLKHDGCYPNTICSTNGTIENVDEVILNFKRQVMNYHPNLKALCGEYWW